MPESKTRHPHKHPQHHSKPVENHSKPKKTNRVVITAVLFFAFIGLGISFFIDGASIPMLLAGAIIGGLAGLFVGNQVNKSLAEKS